MADKTSIQEAAQALFCALADYVGSANIDKTFDVVTYRNYDLFKSFWENDKRYSSQKINDVFNKVVDAPGVTINDIQRLFESDVTWYYSSVQIAKKIVKEAEKIDSSFSKIKSVGWKDLMYVRGDSDVMKNIEKLFKLAQKNEEKLNSIPGGGGTAPLSDVNKWSPADIYFASDLAKRKIKETLREKSSPNSKMNYAVLNTLVSNLIESGDLLPLSLKKQPRDVTIKKVNFDRTAEMKYVSQYKYHKLKWESYRPGVARDLTILINPQNPFSKIVVRHDAAGDGGGVFKGEIVLDKNARGGSFSRGPFIAVIRTVDSSFASRLESQIIKDQQEFAKAKKSILPLKQKNRILYDKLNGENSGVYMNPSFKMLADWLNSNRKRSDTFVQQAYSYMSSRSENSGRFVIAK